MTQSFHNRFVQSSCWSYGTQEISPWTESVACSVATQMLPCHEESLWVLLLQHLSYFSTSEPSSIFDLLRVHLWNAETQHTKCTLAVEEIYKITPGLGVSSLTDAYRTNSRWRGQPCYATERCLPPVCARCVRLPESNGNTLQLLKGFRWFQVEKPRILRQCGPSKIGTFMAEPKLHSSEASGSLEFIRIRVSSHTSCCPHCFTMFHHVSPCFTMFHSFAWHVPHLAGQHELARAGSTDGPWLRCHEAHGVNSHPSLARLSRLDDLTSDHIWPVRKTIPGARMCEVDLHSIKFIWEFCTSK